MEVIRSCDGFATPQTLGIHYYVMFYATCSFITMPSPFLDNYEPLDVIENGSFGIVCKLRKTDGLVRAIGGTFLFPASWLFLADICAQGTEL